LYFKEKKKFVIYTGLIYLVYYFILINFRFQEKFSAILLLFSIFIFENVVFIGEIWFSNSFSIGELMILSQGLTIASIEAFVMFFGDVSFYFSNFKEFCFKKFSKVFIGAKFYNLYDYWSNCFWVSPALDFKNWLF
jgi:hypothetical protein